ncbi:conjugal transfer protein TraF, partial [Cohnella sp. GbtcB17]|uniref:conjugal transfer protein TraF n=1 Tax=Cohnella sp. GbtcB17 TaxID=2824762 RepID=UPI001C2F3AAC
PPAIVRRIASFASNSVIDPQRRAKRRAQAEAARVKAGAPHRVEYFHQHDDPYSHLAQQVLDAFKERYDIELVIHQIRASGGKNQPELA